MCVVVVSGFKLTLRGSNILYLLCRGFINYAFYAAFVGDGAIFCVSAVACSFLLCLCVVLYFSVVVCHYSLHVLSAAIANFYCPSIYYLTEWVVSGEVFVNEFQKFFAYVCF